MKKKIKVIIKNNNKLIKVNNRIINVSRGYAFNYLIPNSIAEIATKHKIKHFKMFEQIQSQKVIQQQLNIKKLKNHLNTISKFNIKKKIGENNNIFGSINEKEICNLISQYSGIDINKKQLIIPTIKKIGSFSIEVLLSESISGHIHLNVIPINL